MTARRLLSAVANAALFLSAAALLALSNPGLPDAWHPGKPLSFADAETPVTHWKLRRALARPGGCATVLDGLATPLPALVDGPNCGIGARVRLGALTGADLDPVETACETALRLALWERHAVAPAARDLLGAGVAEILHLDSYACRPVRTARGEGARMSTHARALAIDITGFVLDDGRRIMLAADWNGGDAAFLRRVRDGACRWFGTVLGPDFNSLHADHFHLQSRGRGLCR